MKTLITAPATEPLVVEEVRNHLRVDDNDEDLLIEGLITAVRENVEAYLRRPLITQTWDLYLDSWPASSRIKLPLPPLQSVTHVKYTDIDDVEETLSSDDYHVDTVSTPGEIVLRYGESWPTATLRTSNPIVVRFVCGYGDASDVPQSIKQAMLLIIGHHFENREITAPITINKVPESADSLLWMKRYMEAV